jgi:ferredoxin/predicted CopG family antitoxin
MAGNVMAGERTVSLDDKAFERLTWAKREEETYSDVVIRLTSTKIEGLQRRGEIEVVTADGRRLGIRIEQGKCSGAESCVTLAPEVFALDPTQLGRTHREPLGVREVMEKQVESEPIIRAVKSCPYGAIHVRDLDSGEVISP